MRAAAVIVDGGNVALIERQRGNTVYYLFPGGTVEAGETPEQAVIREVHEELGLLITVDRLLAQVRFGASVQYYYLTLVQGGAFGTGDGAEVTGPIDPAVGRYTPVWVNVHALKEKPVKPTAVAEFVRVSQTHGWPGAVQHYEEDS